MKNKDINQDAYFERMRELAKVNKVILKESKSSATLLDYKKAADGRLYGIVKENQAYFIKTAQSKLAVSDADFAYIGGLSNITEYKCKSITEAQKVLNTKVMTINETYGGMMEDEQEEDMLQQEPQAQAPAPSPAPEREPAPMPEPEREPEPEEVEKDEVHSAISTAAQKFSDAELEPSKVEYYLKQFLGVVKDSQLSKLRDDQKEGIFNEYFETEQVEEGYLTEEDEYEEDMIDDIEDDGDDELDLDIPEVEPSMGIEPSMDNVVDVESRDKEVHIDLNAGTVNVKLSEGKIKQLAKKYNMSEDYIKWKMDSILKEEIEKVEKEKLNEDKVRKVVRNIIKEKLGLIKKPLRESVSKERLKLEKLVESVLKKKI